MSQACSSNQRRMASASLSGCRWTWASTITFATLPRERILWYDRGGGTMPLAIRIVFGLLLLPLALHAQERCARDSDCQTGSVCTRNVCALPPPPPPPPEEPGALPPAPDEPSYGGTA